MSSIRIYMEVIILGINTLYSVFIFFKLNRYGWERVKVNKVCQVEVTPVVNDSRQVHLVHDVIDFVLSIEYVNTW